MHGSDDPKVVANIMEGILFIFGKWWETFSDDNKFYSDNSCVTKRRFILMMTSIVANNHL